MTLSRPVEGSIHYEAVPVRAGPLHGIPDALFQNPTIESVPMTAAIRWVLVQVRDGILLCLATGIMACVVSPIIHTYIHPPK